jgi:DNA-binding GntR family transcriptional regulator
MRAAGQPSASERAYAHVKGGILDGTREGGQFLTEGEVAEAVGVSRTPVREALLRLEVEGYLRLYPKKGAMIIPVSAQEAQDVIEARGVIEEWAANRIWPYRKEILDDLRGALARMRAAGRANAVDDFVAADHSFHECLVAAAGNAILTREYRALGERQRCVSRSAIRASGATMGRAIAAHRHLIDLLAIGTRAEFLSATSEHLTLAHQLTASVR